MMAVVYATRSDLDDFGGLPDGALANEGRIVAAALAATDTLELDAHGFVTGEELQVRAYEGGALSAPLVDGVTYYAIRVSDSTIRLAATEADATAGNAIDLITSSTSMVVSKPLPIDRHLELYSRWVDDFLPAHLVPLAPDPTTGQFPLVVVRLVALLAGKALLNRDGKSSEIVNQTELAAKAQLERWAKGIPLRDAGRTASANLAITATLSSTAGTGRDLDPRGWGSGRLP